MSSTSGVGAASLTDTHKLCRWVVDVEGRVQGVGFRPFVYKRACDLGIAGTVYNTGNGARLDIEAKSATLMGMLTAVLTQTPPATQITQIAIKTDVPQKRKGFFIRRSHTGESLKACVLPDLATCPDCLSELHDPSDRRFRYPFINCTACGPRYSIILNLPYDRDNTTMRSFRMCRTCRREYEDPSHRRFHAQPNACPECGPQVSFYEKGQCLAKRESALQKAIHLVDQGGILALKGLGGFQLIVDATNPDAVKRLRLRKHRPAKPFAVMVADVAMAEDTAILTDQEKSCLASVEAPIVLVPYRAQKYGRLAASVAPGHPWVGLFLPYTPLHHLLLEAWKRPVVVTSGNISEEPLCIDNDEAFVRLKDVADGFLVHDRPIARPVDDSVVMMAAGRRLMIRRARGFAPDPLWVQGMRQGCLACGAQQKNTVAVTGRDRVYVSQHIGDLENVPTQHVWRHAVEDLTHLFQLSVTEAVVDAHPQYSHRTLLARTTPVHQIHEVAHHHAHIAAVMAEHGLKGPVLGLAWDGTGWGVDGTLWGGEFLIVKEDGFVRKATFLGFPLPGHEAAIRRPVQTAAGLLFTVYEDAWMDHCPSAMVDKLGKQTCLVLTRLMRNKTRSIMTHAVGRLFDGVSALLGLRFEVSYEGEAAAVLEAACLDQVSDRTYDIPMRATGDGYGALDWRGLIREILRDFNDGCPVSQLAARFHDSLVQTTVKASVDLCHREGIDTVVLGGGCFQNKRLLCGLIQGFQERGLRVSLPEEFPLNDGGLCVGQAAVAASLKAGN